MFHVQIIDEFENWHRLPFAHNEYPSLLELIRHQLGSDIGDCRGRVWCNTCVVRKHNGMVNSQQLDAEEQQLLQALPMTNIRLSCQVNADHTLDGTLWKIEDSRKYH